MFMFRAHYYSTVIYADSVTFVNNVCPRNFYIIIIIITNIID